ncbi:MAG: serine hydrolase [Chitinophagaceae bacterium]
MKKLTLFLLTCGLTWQSFAQTGSLADKPGVLDRLMKAYEKLDLFNGSILVAAGDKVIYQSGFGWKNTAAGIRNDANTLYRIYSVTKTFTSTVILKLAEEHKIALDDRLSRFYPSFPNGDSITIQQLLSHTSGVYDYTRGNDMKDQSEHAFVTFLSSKPLDFPPGKGWSYSNSGYWLLGFIISKVTDMSYEDAVKKYIFVPCGMNNSGFDFKTMKHVNKATGYETFSEKFKTEAIDIDPPGPYAAGAIYSSVKDMYRYYRALQSFQLISQSSLAKAWTPDSLNARYALGWQVGRFGEKEMFFHGGGGPGFKSNFAMIPTDQVCIVLLTNNENAHLDPLTRMICNVLFEHPYKIPFSVSVDSAVLSDYEGYYGMDGSFSLHISQEAGRLIAQASGQSKTTLFAENVNYFYAPDADAYLEFRSNGKRKSDTLILRQGERVLTGKRYTPAWGILGSATNAGWGDKPDEQMLLTAGRKNAWYIKDIQLRSGVLKFRFNNDWNMNYGKGDLPGLLKLNGADISVEAGIYDIELDLSDPEKPAYLLNRK